MAQPFSAKSVRRTYAWKQPRILALHRALKGAERDINYGWISRLSTELDDGAVLCRRTINGIQSLSAVDRNGGKRSLSRLSARSSGTRRSLRRPSSSVSVERQTGTHLTLINAEANGNKAKPTQPMEASELIQNHLSMVGAALLACVVDLRATISSARKFGAEAFRRGDIKRLERVVKAQAQLTACIETIELLHENLLFVVRESYGEDVEAKVSLSLPTEEAQSIARARKKVGSLKRALFNEGADLFLAEENHTFERVREVIDIFSDFESDIETVERRLKQILAGLLA